MPEYIVFVITCVSSCLFESCEGGGREEGEEEGRDGGKEGGRKGGREKRREGGKERGRRGGVGELKFRPGYWHKRLNTKTSASMYLHGGTCS